MTKTVKDCLKKKVKDTGKKLLTAVSLKSNFLKVLFPGSEIKKNKLKLQYLAKQVKIRLLMIKFNKKSDLKLFKQLILESSLVAKMGRLDR